ncbi:hypothetical protein OUZ56_010508 [Daphnia magna]|uniref:Uncharacterized protein n=1 Tax=Daphnia magna TaxID=35525 RepID=A0ABR0AIP8_9CRUS|nr:hypothetical protein OUZ56_010508 [Daphnia magna]
MAVFLDMGRPKLPKNEEEAKIQKAKRLEAQVEAREKKAFKRKAQNLAKKLVENKNYRKSSTSQELYEERILWWRIF